MNEAGGILMLPEEMQATLGTMAFFIATLILLFIKTV